MLRLSILIALPACTLASAPPVAEIAPAATRALGARIGVPVELVTFDSAGKVSSYEGQWDIAFPAIDPARAAEIAFTVAYVLIEGAYLVPASSPINSNVRAPTSPAVF